MARFTPIAAMLLALVALESVGQTPYLRSRPGAEEWSRRGGGYVLGPSHGGYPVVPSFGSFQTAFAGNWYERPYPYHFDYYRSRWGVQEPVSAAPDCPCAVLPEAAP